MEMKRILLSLLLFSCGIQAHAANVLWNCFELYTSGTLAYIGSSEAREYGVAPELRFYVNSLGAGVSIVADTEATTLANCSTWVLVELYDMSGFDTVRACQNAFSRSGMDGVAGHETGSSFEVQKGDDFYFAIATTSPGASESGFCLYGWVCLNVDETAGLSITTSALDLDGGPMIVGGGSAIPEPSGGLLFLLGGAAVALRRRKRTPVGAFLTSRGDELGR